MSKQVKIRRGTAAEHASFTGVVGEVTVDTTNDSIRVHNGATVGGRQMARADGVNASGSWPIDVTGNAATATTATNATNATTATTISSTLPINKGGTNATTASAARTSLGLGTLATASTVNLGTQVTSTLPIANGGTGATSAAAALAALGGLGITGSELTGQGYLELSNGLHLIWGSFTAAGNGSTTYSYTTTNAAISLSTFSVAVVSGGPSSGGDNPPHVTACTTSGFTVYNAFGSTVTTFFVAIGV